MTDYRAFLRRRLLEDMYDKLSPEEKRLFIQMSMQDKSSEEILRALQTQEKKLDEIHKSQSWWLDLSANIAGSALWDSFTFIGSKLLRKL